MGLAHIRAERVSCRLSRADSRSPGTLRANRGCGLQLMQRPLGRRARLARSAARPVFCVGSHAVCQLCEGGTK